MSELDEQMDEIFSARDRAHMQATIDAFQSLLSGHPTNARLLYEVGGSYDTAGQEEAATEYYARALAANLAGELRRRCLLQYASSLGNLGRFDASLAMFDQAIREFPGSPSLQIFKALTLHEAGTPNAAFALLLTTIADHLQSPEIARYNASIRGNADHIRALDG